MRVVLFWLGTSYLKYRLTATYSAIAVDSANYYNFKFFGEWNRDYWIRACDFQRLFWFRLSQRVLWLHGYTLESFDNSRSLTNFIISLFYSFFYFVSEAKSLTNGYSHVRSDEHVSSKNYINMYSKTFMEYLSKN